MKWINVQDRINPCVHLNLQQKGDFILPFQCSAWLNPVDLIRRADSLKKTLMRERLKAKGERGARG